MGLQQAGLEWINKGLDSFISGINKANAAIQESGKKSSQSGESFSALGGIVTGASMAITNGLINAGKSVVAFAKDSVGMAASFEGAAARLKIAGTGAAAQAGVALDDLSEAALKVGNDSRLMGVSATGASAAMTNLLKAGLSLNDVMGDTNAYMNEGAELGGVLAASIQLAVASELDMVGASELATTTMTIFGLSAEEVADAMDYIVRGADASVGSVTGLKEGLEGTGPTLRALGFSIEDAVDALSLLSNAGMSGAEAGTALRSAFSTMASDKKKVVAAFQEVGMSIVDASGNFLSFKEILGMAEQATLSMTEAEKRQFLTTISGHYGQTAMNALINQGTAGYAKYEEALLSAAGMQQQAGTMSETFGGRMEALTGNIETLRIEIGTQFLPVGTQLIGIFSELVQNYGPQMIAVAGGIATGISGLIETISNLPPWLITSGAEIGALGIAVITGTSAFIKLVPVVASLIPVIQTAIAGIQLFGVHSSVATMASLGWQAALIPIAVVLAAVVASIIAVNMAIDLHNKVVEKTAEVTDAWTGFLQEQAATQTSATDIAQAYIDKQREVNKAYEEGGIIAQLFINKQEVLNADIAVLNDTLVKSSTGYEEYLGAVKDVNEAVTESSRVYNQYGKDITNTAELAEKLIKPLSESEYWITQNTDAYREYQMALRASRPLLSEMETWIIQNKDAYIEYKKALVSTTKIDLTQTRWAEYMQATAQATSEANEVVRDSAGLFTGLTDGLKAARTEAEPFDRAMYALQQSLGGVATFAEEQNSALLLLSLAYDKGIIGIDAYVAGGEEIMSVSESDTHSLDRLQSAVNTTTGGFYALDSSMQASSGTMARVASETMVTSQAQETLASAVNAVWKDVAQDAETAIGGALSAYETGNANILEAAKTHNADMIAEAQAAAAAQQAEQQAALGKMLTNKVETLYLERVITKEQYMDMRVAIAEEYGIIVDDTKIATDKTIGIVQAWADGTHGITAEMVVDTHANIVEMTDGWVEETKQMTADANASWVEHKAVIAGEGAAVARSVDTMINDIVADIDRGTSKVGDINTALTNIVEKDWTVDVIVNYKPGEGVGFESPNFKVYHALERFIDLAKDPIDIAVESTNSVNTVTSSIAEFEEAFIKSDVNKLGNYLATAFIDSVQGGMRGIATDMMPAAPVSMPMMTRDVNNSRSVVVEVNANYTNSQSEASIYYDVVAALSGVRI